MLLFRRSSETRMGLFRNCQRGALYGQRRTVYRARRLQKCQQRDVWLLFPPSPSCHLIGARSPGGVRQPESDKARDQHGPDLNILLRVAEVCKLDMKVDGGKVVEYRARVSLSFKYET